MTSCAKWHWSGYWWRLYKSCHSTSGIVPPTRGPHIQTSSAYLTCEYKSFKLAEQFNNKLANFTPFIATLSGLMNLCCGRWICQVVARACFNRSLWHRPSCRDSGGRCAWVVSVVYFRPIKLLDCRWALDWANQAAVNYCDIPDIILQFRQLLVLGIVHQDWKIKMKVC